MPDYEKRLMRVIDYLHHHLDEECDLMKIAEIACMSHYHWHRIYQACFQETLAATVRRLRMHRAAYLLTQTSQSIRSIAVACAYPSVPSFTRIFTQQFGMPPAQFRKKGEHRPFSIAMEINDGKQFPVEVQDTPHLHLVGRHHQGSYMHIGRAFDQLMGICGARAWLAHTPTTHNPIQPIQALQATSVQQPAAGGLQMIGVYWDDPNLIATAELRSFAGLAVTASSVQQPAMLAPLDVVHLPAGRYAKLIYQGPYADMHAAYEWLFGTWLIQSGYEAADAPVFEHYVNNPRDVLPSALMTHIYLPLVF